MLSSMKVSNLCGKYMFINCGSDDLQLNPVQSAISEREVGILKIHEQRFITFIQIFDNLM